MLRLAIDKNEWSWMIDTGANMRRKRRVTSVGLSVSFKSVQHDADVHDGYDGG